MLVTPAGYSRHLKVHFNDLLGWHVQSVVLVFEFIIALGFTLAMHLFSATTSVIICMKNS